MTKKQIIKRLCSLCKEVLVTKFNAEIPADCFCMSYRGYHASFFNFDEKILLFIESAVMEKLKPDLEKLKPKKHDMEVEKIVALLTGGMLTDEKLMEASAKLEAFKMERLFGRTLETKEVY